MIQITQKYMPIGLRRSGEKITPKIMFLVAHDTGNDGATAQNHVDYYTRTYNDQQVSAHTFVDDKMIVEVVPLNEKAWHVRYNVNTDNTLFGYDANDTAVGVELCYSTKGIIDNKIAYNNYVDYFAYLCMKYNLDPLQHIVSHTKLDPTRRTDPINAFNHTGVTWNQFIQDVSRVYTENKPKPPTGENPTGTASDMICSNPGKRVVLNTVFELFKKLFA